MSIKAAQIVSVCSWLNLLALSWYGFLNEVNGRFYAAVVLTVIVGIFSGVIANDANRQERD